MSLSLHANTIPCNCFFVNVFVCHYFRSKFNFRGHWSTKLNWNCIFMPHVLIQCSHWEQREASFLLFMLNLWVLLRRVEAMMMRTIVRLAPFLWRTDWPIPYRSQKRIWSRNISLFYRSTAEHGQGIYNISEEETLSNLFPHRNMEYLLMFHLDISNLNFSYEITIRST